MESESEVVLWPGLSVGEAVRRRAGGRSERSGWRDGPESEVRVSFLLGQAFRSVIGLPFWPIVQILGPAHELRVYLLRPSLCWKAGP